MTPDRAQEWVRLSHNIAALFRNDRNYQVGPLWTLQMLVRFERDIDNLEMELRSAHQKGNGDLLQFDRVASYTVFWVLGAYEITRTLAQKTKDLDLKAARHKFER